MITERSLELFHKAAREVPAYAKFLKERGFDPKKVKTVPDLASVPITSKKSYLQTSERNELLWNRDLQSTLWFCSTSGSTGEPYYFPRNENLAWQASHMAENFLKNSSYGQGRTLLLVGFGMGVWIGGTFTVRQFEIAAERMGAALSILPIGYNKNEMFKALKKLAPDFDQTIICGYPPFVKEIIDEADDNEVDLQSLNIRLLFAAEAFTETFRNYVTQKAQVKNVLLDTLNVYGTADVGAMAHETPLSILIRRLVIEDPLLLKDTFGQLEKTPTLAQYHPDFIEFETDNNQILLTADGALPLIRYAIGDNGGIFTYDEIKRLLKRYDIDIEEEAKKAGINHTVKHDPFIFVYERSDLSVTLHGIIIYPEFIKEGLLKPAVTADFTERFTMSTKNDVHHNQFLQINLELQRDVEPSKKIEEKVHKAITASLVQKSSEFSEISKSRSSHDLIQVVLWPNGHPRYFAPGTKQKWVEKI